MLESRFARDTALPSAGAEQRQAMLFLLTTMVLFGSAFTSSKVTVQYFPHEVAALLRFGGGAIFLGIIAAWRRHVGVASPLDGRGVLAAAATGLLGVFGYNAFFFLGLSMAPSIDGSAIVPVLSPVLTVAILGLAGVERIRQRVVVGLTLGIVGVAVFIGSSAATASGGLTGTRALGDLVFLAGALCWALYTISSKKLLAGKDPVEATTWATIAGTGGLLLLAAPELPEGLASTSLVAWLNVAYLAAGPTALAYLCYARGLSKSSPTTATIMMLTVPLFSFVTAYAFLGERFSAWGIAGVTLMFAGAMVTLGLADRVRALVRNQSPG